MNPAVVPPSAAVGPGKRRHPYLAGLLSLLFPGLGQMYNTQLGKGLGLALLSLALSAVFAYSPLVLHLPGGVAMFALELLLGVAIILDAFLVARRKGTVALRRYNSRWGYSLFIAVTIVISAIAYFCPGDRVRPMRMASTCMSPTLVGGDHVAVDRWAYRHQPPRPGDVITFTPPDNRAVTFLMRCVAVCGETVEIREGKLLLDGVEQARPPIAYSPGGRLQNYGPLTLPADTCFVLGDNSRVSKDSRFFGPVPLADVQGRVLYIYWSWDFSRLGRPVT